MGRSVHSATVADFATATAIPLDPLDAKTLAESTTRFDNLGRAIARTQWLVARGAIDAANPPIAGLDGVPSADGLTTQTFYDTNLKDDIGFDNTGGITIPRLGGGTYQLSLRSVIDQLSQAESLGWPAISFSRTAPGSAVVSIGSDQTIHASISDSAGRTVFQGQLQPWNGPQPFALVSWSCQRYDIVANISGFGDVVETRNVDPLGKTTRSRSDGSGRTLESYDQENRLSTMTHDAVGNVITMLDPNGVGYNAVYDELGRMTSQTDTWGDTTAMSYDKEGNVRTQTDAKNHVTTIVYDARNRRKTATDRLAGVTTFNWHPAGHLASIVDAEGQTTS